MQITEFGFELIIPHYVFIISSRCWSFCVQNIDDFLDPVNKIGFLCTELGPEMSEIAAAMLCPTQQSKQAFVSKNIGLKTFQVLMNSAQSMFYLECHEVMGPRKRAGNLTTRITSFHHICII